MLAINTVFFVALAALGVVVFRDGSFKHHGSVARRGFLWFQIALWLAVLYVQCATPSHLPTCLTDRCCSIKRLFFALITSAGNLVRYTGVGNSTPESEMAFERLSIFTTFVSTAGAAILMLCITKLIVGTKAVAKQQKSSKYSIFVTAFVALVVLLSFIVMVLREVIVFRYIWDSRQIFNQIRVAAGAMHVAAIDLLLIGGLANTIFAWIQRGVTRKDAGGVYSKVGTFVSAIASIQLFVFTWTFIGGIIVTLGLGTRNLDFVGWKVLSQEFS